jgi:hypothetical protein
MIDQLLSIKTQCEPTEVFAVINTTMDQTQAVDLLLSVFDYDCSEALSKALVAEIKRRKALETKRADRVKAVRRKVKAA